MNPRPFRRPNCSSTRSTARAAHQVITSPSEASHPDGRYVTCPVARSRLASFTEFVPLA